MESFLSNDTGHSPRCEASDNRFLLAKMNRGKFGESYASNGPMRLPKQQPIGRLKWHLVPTSLLRLYLPIC